VKFKSTVLTDTSGSLNGATFSHNTYGYYIRQRVTPTNPASPAQQATRVAMSTGHAAWEALPQATKDAWEAYAQGTPIYDRLGAAIKLTGRLMFLRDYVLRTRDGRALPPTVITDMGLSTLSALVLTATAPASGSLAYQATDDWCVTTGGILFIACSRGISPGRSFYQGPYRTCGVVLGNTGAPPASPAAFTLPFNVQAGQKVFFRCIASDYQGRLSAPFLGFDICG
jgi:hypothetical protein